MRVERCPDCGIAGAACGCAPGGGFDPLRIRPYVTLTDPGEPEVPTHGAPRQGAVAAPHRDTPAYGVRVPPAYLSWSEPDPRAAVLQPASRVPVPGAGGPTVGPGRAGRRSEERTDRAFRRPAPLLLAATVVLAMGGTAVTLWTPASSGDVMVPDARPSAPASAVPPGSSPTSSARSSGPSTSASRSPSPSASRPASPSASPDPSHAASPSASPSPTPSASRSPGPKPPPPTQAPTLRYGDSGPEVKRLQKLLAAQGLYKGKVNGRFDARVKQAVAEFQVDRDVDDDGRGTYGPATRRALEG